jgi:uroporphyrinogen decarboxylase
MEEVLVDLLTGEPDLFAFLDRLVAYWQALIGRLIDLGVDVIMFGDDWGTQLAPVVSPELFREVFAPRYRLLFEPIRRAGRKILFHSCGFLRNILDELIDLGVDGLWPQMSLYDRDSGFAQKCADRWVTLFLHPDRQKLMPLGTPGQIDTVIRGYGERTTRFGGRRNLLRRDRKRCAS